MGEKGRGPGGGEILLTSMDADGTKKGFDLEMTRAVTRAVRIPVIASGGCGALEHFSDVFEQADARCGPGSVPVPLWRTDGAPR